MTAQLSPYDPKSNILSTIRQRKNRDTHKKWLTHSMGAQISPRRKSYNPLNSVNAYPKTFYNKTRPGSNYESPYSIRKINKEPEIVNVSTLRPNSSPQRMMPPVVKSKSPIKPYKNDLNYFPGYNPTKLPVPKPKPVYKEPEPRPDIIYY